MPTGSPPRDWAKRWGRQPGPDARAVPGVFSWPLRWSLAQKKGAIFAANLYEPLGYRCIPGAGESRHDIIQAVELGSEEAMVAFCRGIQAAAPVDSFATPMPWDMPGYDCQVIMAAGAFVQGSSIELSADGPIRPPLRRLLQGGLTWKPCQAGHSHEPAKSSATRDWCSFERERPWLPRGRQGSEIQILTRRMDYEYGFNRGKGRAGSVEILHSPVRKHHFSAAVQPGGQLGGGKFIGEQALAAVGNSYESPSSSWHLPLGATLAAPWWYPGSLAGRITAT